MSWLCVLGLILFCCGVLAVGVFALYTMCEDAMRNGPAARRARAAYWLSMVLMLVGMAMVCQSVSATDVTIPADSVRYRLQLERAAGAQWGLDAPVARLAAQLHQESGWNPSARSYYAHGLAQFTPPTAAWLPQICPQVGPSDPWDAGWSIRAMVCYDAWLHDRAPGATGCDRWAMTLSAYNGGERARDRERAQANLARDDPLRWFGQVERYRSRSDDAWRENRTYVRRILLTLEPAYIAAGWPGTRACP